MKMPVIGFCHRGDPNNMVIDLCNWMILVSEMGRRLCLQGDDFGKVSIHSEILAFPILALINFLAHDFGLFDVLGLFSSDHGELGNNEGGSERHYSQGYRCWDKGACPILALSGHSLRYDLSAPPPASQVFAMRVASARQTML